MVQLHDLVKGDDHQLSQMFEKILASQQDQPSDDKLTQEPDNELDRVDLKLAQVSLSSTNRPFIITQHTTIPQQESSSDHQTKHITNQSKFPIDYSKYCIVLNFILMLMNIRF